jgi:hypothetical protein
MLTYQLIPWQACLLWVYNNHRSASPRSHNANLNYLILSKAIDHNTKCGTTNCSVYLLSVFLG